MHRSGIDAVHRRRLSLARKLCDYRLREEILSPWSTEAMENRLDRL
jgi:hypothetical protein